MKRPRPDVERGVDERGTVIAMTSTLPRYRASGRTSPRFLLTAAAAGATAIGLGWAYQALTGAGYLALNLLLYLLLAIGVAAAVVTAGRLGRNRNRALGALVGLAIGGAALTSAYGFDHRAMAAEVAATTVGGGSDGGAPSLTFGQFVDRRVAAGWTFGKRHPGDRGTLTGGWVWLAWTLEAFGVVALALGFGVAFGPFCETCRRWIPAGPLLVRPDVDAATVAAVAAATTPAALFPPAPPPGAPTGPLSLVYTTHRCPTCAADAYVTIIERRVVPPTRPSRGPTTSSQPLHVQVAVPRALLPSPTAPPR